MNKKFLSAILFGALMVTSTGTFVSCKDYDDDIEDLQTQIDANAKSIADLKATLDGANYVTDVTISGNNLVVTTKTGGSKTIALPEDQKGSMVTVNAEGYLEIDGKATDIKACEAKEEGEYLAPVKIEGGEWMVLQEDGTYAPLGLKASSVAVTGNETDGYVLTVTDGEGNETVIELPTAASSLTDLIVAQDENNLNYAVYNYKGTVKIADWKGPKTLPAEKGKTVKIVAGVLNPLIQINPTTVDAADLTLNLIDSKNNVPAYLSFTPQAYTELLSSSSRAANANGLYTLAMNEVLVPSDKLTAFKNQFGNYKLYAVTAGTEVRSEYEVTVAEVDTVALSTLSIVDANGVANQIKVSSPTDINTKYPVTAWAMSDGITYNTNCIGNAENPQTRINPNEWYYVTADNAAALYDMHLSVSEEDKTLFGVEIEEVAGVYKFRSTVKPDEITRAAFRLTIETINKSGKQQKAYVWIGQTSILTDAYAYDAVQHQLVANNTTASKEKNFFSIDLNLMKNAMTATNKALWNSYAKAYDLTIVDPNNNNTLVATDANGIVPEFVTELKDGKTVKVASTYGAANYLKFHISNNTASVWANNYINEDLTAVINFYKDAAKKELLNTIYVPFKMTIPALGNYLPKQQGVFNGTQDGTAYIFGTSLVNPEQSVRALQYDMTYAFDHLAETLAADGTVLEFYTDGKINGTGDVLVKFVDSSKTTYVDSDAVNTMSATKAALIALKGENQDVYGQPFKIEIANTTKYIGYYSWSDTERAAEAFTIKMLSPIAEGKLTAADGTQTISITSTDQLKITESKFAIATYANIAYKLFPSAGTKAASDIYDWITYNAQGTVTITSKDTKVLTVKSIANGTDATATAAATEGYVEVAPVNAAYDTNGTITVVVNDAWGFKLEQDVTIAITK